MINVFVPRFVVPISLLVMGLFNVLYLLDLILVLHMYLVIYQFLLDFPVFNASSQNMIL